MTTPNQIADRLLDAQVAWAIGEVTGPRLAEVLGRDVDDLLAIASRHRLVDIADPADVKATVRRVAAVAAGSGIVESLSADLAAAVHGLPNAGDYTLEDVVAREDVEALIAKLLSMHRLHERALNRVADSPQVGVVASKFVTKIVGDILAQNRERAEKLPGVSSLFSLGSAAVSRARSVTDPLLGDAGAKGAQFAIRRTNAALLELVRDAPLQEAAMEIWDLHADEPLSELRAYLTARDVRELAALIHALVAGAGETDYLGEVLDACVDVVFDTYGERDVASLLDEAGIARDDLGDVVVRHASALLTRLDEAGDLDLIIRERLAPFFASPQVLAVLAGEEPRPAKAAKPKTDGTKTGGAKAAGTKKKPKPRPD